MQTHVYPTTPTRLQQPEGEVGPSPHHPFAEGGEHVESPGKSKGPLSKVKNKAKKLKDKLKKVTGSKSRGGHRDSDTHDQGDLNIKHEGDHGDRAYQPHPREYEHSDVDGGRNSYEDDDEEEEHILLGDDQSKYEQVQSLGAMGKPAGGSAPYQSAGPQHDSPISPYKNDGPPNTLQAAPTVYHYPPASNDQVLGGLRDTPHEQVKPSPLQDMPYTSYNNVPTSTDTSLEQLKPAPSDDVSYASYDNAPPKPSLSHDLPYASHDTKVPEDSSLEAGILGLPMSTGVKRPDRSSYSPTRDAFSQREPTSSESPTASGVDVAYPDDIVKPNPEFGRSFSPMHSKIAVINEDVPPETRQDVGLAPDDYGSQDSLLNKSVPENAPMSFGEADKNDRPDTDTVAGSFLKSPADVLPTSTYSMTGGQKFDVSKQEDERGIHFSEASSPTKDDSESRPGSDTVAGSFLKSPADVLPTSTYSMAGGQKFDVSKQEDERGIHFTEASFPRTDDRESMPLDTPDGDELSGRGKEDKSALPEYASKRDESVDRQPISDAFARPFFTSLADEMPKTMDKPTGGQSFDSNEPEDLRDSRAVSSFGKDQIKEPPVTAIGDDTSGRKKDDEIEGYMNESNDVVSGQSMLSQNASDEGVGQSLDNTNMEPASSDQKSWGAWSADKLNNAKDAVTTTLIGSEKTAADEQPNADTRDDVRRQSPLSHSGFDGVGQSSYNDNVEPASGDDQKSWGAWSADKLYNVKDAATATLMGSDKRTADEQSMVDTKDVSDDNGKRQSPLSQNEVENEAGQSSYSDNVEPARGDQKSWGVWAADKLYNVKDAAAATLMGSDKRAADEPMIDAKEGSDDDGRRQSPLGQNEVEGGVRESSYNANVEPTSGDQKSWGAWSADKLYNVKDAAAATLIGSAAAAISMGSDKRAAEQPIVDTENVADDDARRRSPLSERVLDRGVYDNEKVEPGSNDQKSWGAWSADKLYNVKDAVATTLMGPERTAAEQPVVETENVSDDASTQPPFSQSEVDGRVGQSPYGKNVQPANDDQKSWGAWSADKLIDAKDAMTTTMMGSHKRHVNVEPTVDTEDVLNDDTRSHPPFDQNVVDGGVGQPSYDGDAEPANSNQKSWGAWSADKLNSAKDTVTTTLLGSDRKDAGEQPIVDTTDTTLEKGESEEPLPPFKRAESEEPLITAIGDEMSGRRKDNEMETGKSEWPLATYLGKGESAEPLVTALGDKMSSRGKDNEMKGESEEPRATTSLVKSDSEEPLVTVLSDAMSGRREENEEEGISEEPLVTAFGDDMSGHRKENQMESYLYGSNDDARGEPPSSQNVLDDVASRQSPSGKNVLDDDATVQPPIGKNLIPQTDMESWGKQSADNFNNEKGGQSETQQVDGDDKTPTDTQPDKTPTDTQPESLYGSNDDARGEPPSSQNVLDDIASRQSPSGKNVLDDDATVQPPIGKNLVPQTDMESWGKRSADNFNNEKGGQSETQQVDGDDKIPTDTQPESLYDSADNNSTVGNATTPTIGAIPILGDDSEKRSHLREDINTNLDDSNAGDVQPESINESADKGVNAAGPIPIVGDDEEKRPYDREEINTNLDVDAPVGAIPITGDEDEKRAYSRDINRNSEDSRAADTQPKIIYDSADKDSNVFNAAAPTIDNNPIVDGDDDKWPSDREEINSNLNVDSPVGAIPIVGGGNEKQAHPHEDINTNLDAADTQSKNIYDSADKGSNVFNAAAPAIDTVSIVGGDDDKRPNDCKDISTDLDMNTPAGVIPLVGGEEEKRTYPLEEISTNLDDSRAADTQPRSVYNSADKSSKIVNACAPTIGTILAVGGDDEKQPYEGEDINTNRDVNATNEGVKYSDPNNSSNSQSQGVVQGEAEDNAEPYKSDDVSSPQDESEKSEGMGIVQGLRNTMASTLGYGLSSPKPSHEQGVREQRATPLENDEQVNAAQSQQQSGGAPQELQNVIASQLGYGESDQEPQINDQTMYDVSGEHSNAQRAGHTSNVEVESTTAAGQQPKGGILQGLRNVVAAKLGLLQKPAGDNVTEATRDVGQDEVPAVSSALEEEQMHDGNDDARGEPTSSQNVVNDVASRQSPSGEKGLYDDATVQSPIGKNLLPQNDMQESWGKWSADKFNNQKDLSETQVDGDDSIATDTQPDSLYDSADNGRNVGNATAHTTDAIPILSDDAEKRSYLAEDIDTNLDDSSTADVQAESIYDSSDKGRNILDAAVPTIGTIPIVGGDEEKQSYDREEINTDLDVDAPVGAIPIVGDEDEKRTYSHEGLNRKLEGSTPAGTRPESIYDSADKDSNVFNAAAPTIDNNPILNSEDEKRPSDREEINTNLDLADSQPKSIHDSADKGSNVFNAGAPTIDGTIPVVGGEDVKRPYDREDISTDLDVNAAADAMPLVGGEENERTYPCEDIGTDWDDSRAVDTQPVSTYDSANKGRNIVNAAAPPIATIPTVGGDDEERPYEGEDINTNRDVNTTKEDAEYYDPNDSSKSQFQEGFVQGTGEAEEEALNSTVAGSAIGKLQGLTDVVATKLGLSGNTHPDTLNVESGEVADAKPYRTNDVSTPQDESQKAEGKGIVQGLRNTVASTLGYDGLFSPKPSHEQDVREQRVTPLENDEHVNAAHQSQQQSGGAEEGLKNVIASKLDYGASDQQSQINDQTIHDESGEHANAQKAGHTSNVEVDSTPAVGQQRKGVLQGLRNVVAAKFGLLQKPAGDNATEATRDVGHDEVPAISSALEEEQMDGGKQPVNYTQKLYETAAAAKDYILSPKAGKANLDRVEEDKKDRNISLAPEEEKATYAM